MWAGRDSGAAGSVWSLACAGVSPRRGGRPSRPTRPSPAREARLRGSGATRRAAPPPAPSARASSAANRASRATPVRTGFHAPSRSFPRRSEGARACARLLVRPFTLEPRQAPLPLGVCACRPPRGLIAPRLAAPGPRPRPASRPLSPPGAVAINAARGLGSLPIGRARRRRSEYLPPGRGRGRRTFRRAGVGVGAPVGARQRRQC